MIVIIFSVLASVVLAADPQRCCGPNKYMATIMTLSADTPLMRPGDATTKTVS